MQRILPETEAHPAALLTDFLTGFGNLIGRTAYAVADGAHHYCNLFTVTVGPTSTARKGTAWKRISPVLKMIDEDWVKDNIESGLSSGEGVIHRIRNKIEETKPIAKTVTPANTKRSLLTQVDDKRLLIAETNSQPVKSNGPRRQHPFSSAAPARDGDALST